MRYRTLPRTDVRSRRSASASGRSPPAGGATRTTARRWTCCARRLEQGITLYDTADSYGNGRGETILADAFAGRRDEVVYSTKVGYDWYSHSGPRGQRELPHDWTPAFVRRSCERSLERLGTDRIDVYQLTTRGWTRSAPTSCSPPSRTSSPRGRCAPTASRWGRRSAGATRAWRRSRHGRSRRWMMIHNVLEQDPAATSSRAREADTGLFVRVPHSSGMLEGKYTTETTFPPSDHRSHRPALLAARGHPEDRGAEVPDRRPPPDASAGPRWLLAEPW